MEIRRASSRDANYRYPTIGDFLRAFEGEKPAEASTAEPLYHEQVVVTQRHSRLWLAVPALLVLGVGFSTQTTVRTGFVRLWHGEWPFAKAEYTSETSVDAPARRENSKVATTETRGGTEKGDTSRGQPRTKVGDGTSTLPQTPEQGRGADPYPREQAGAARATPNTQQGGTSSRVNPPKSEPAIVGAAPGKGDRGGDNGRPGQSAAASNGNRDSLVRSRVSSIAVALEGGGRAIVVIDNQARGVTPLLWQGTPGQHVVALRGVTATPSSISITATAGDTVRAVFTRSRP
jgi:hypothetical protein